jgi:hypothetical protein
MIMYSVAMQTVEPSPCCGALGCQQYDGPQVVTAGKAGLFYLKF